MYVSCTVPPSHWRVSRHDVTHMLAWIHLQLIAHMLLSKLMQMCYLHIFQCNQVPHKCKHSQAFAFTDTTSVNMYAALPNN